MIFQFGIVAIAMICGTILVLAGQPEIAKWLVGGGVFVFVVSLL